MRSLLLAAMVSGALFTAGCSAPAQAGILDAPGTGADVVTAHSSSSASRSILIPLILLALIAAAAAS